MAEKYYMDWNEYDSMIVGLHNQIAKKYQPNHIVAVGRGGFVPAVTLSHLFGARVSPVVIQSYLGQQQNEVHYEENLETLERLKGRVLVVDDLTENGLTLIRIRDKISTEVKFATLYHKLSSKLTPDFYQQITDKWIVFPWEKEYYEHRWSFIKNE